MRKLALWSSFLLPAFALSGGFLAAFLGNFGLFFAVAFIAMLWGLFNYDYFRCRNCGRSIFKLGRLLGGPWPVRKCTRCGADVRSM